MPTDPTPAPPTDAERLREIAGRWRPTTPSHATFLAAFADRLEALEVRNATLERLATAASDPNLAAALDQTLYVLGGLWVGNGLPGDRDQIRAINAFLAALKEATQP